LNVVTDGNELVKFADDTYIVIPATNVNNRQSELNNIHRWADANNLKANLSKYAEIIFADGQRRTKQKIHFPTYLRGIIRVTTIKILGVTFTNSLSVAEHDEKLFETVIRYNNHVLHKFLPPQ